MTSTMAVLALPKLRKKALKRRARGSIQTTPEARAMRDNVKPPRGTGSGIHLELNRFGKYHWF